THFKGRLIRSGGHGFAGIERKKLLNILQAHCEANGVKLVFEYEVGDLEPYQDCDLIIACDGLNSGIRTRLAGHFKPQIEVRKNKFVWLGTKKLFDAFTFIFVETEWGWFQAHAYRFNEDTSTFIVETPESVFEAAGIDKMSQEAGIKFCENLFADYLDGNPLISNAKHLRGSAIWINFPRVSNERWVKDNIVLMGDAAHTAHFSIGSGTKLAMEDAISLARLFEERPKATIRELLAAYEEERKVEVIKIQSSARNSMEWFENVARYTHMEPEQFTYSMLTRSQRVSHENLRLRDVTYLEDMERWFASKATGKTAKGAVPPMFTPFKLRDLTLANRIVVSPMATYSADDGVPGDFHLVHLGARAQGGAGLVMTEMTCVSPQGRISPGCTGLWNDEPGRAFARITGFVHRNTKAHIGLQLGHSGPKGSTGLGWDGADEPLKEGNWPLIAASPVKWAPANQTPREATRADMEQVIAQFADATRRGAAADFDLLELHAAHGYLLSSFISPLTNRREDDYGGTIDNRLRFPLEVFDAMRAAWPAHKPISVR
ncbi:MAG TPA: FAD-dependent monooxygenase, partial [Hyphomicrobiales bacterium]|nr:FAD-dependent monooxygenase [Hyphomicrobiales bacterium]